MTKFSIITPVYNTAQYLDECIQSVLNQDFQDWEMLIINDESPDNSLEILKKYEVQDNRIRVFSKKNEGQGVARNFALQQATGDYILYLDSDDWFEPNSLNKIYKKFQEDNYDVIFFNAYNFFEKTQKKNVYLYNDCFYKHFKDKPFDAKTAAEILFQTNGLSFKAYNRKFLIDNKIQYSPTKYIEDSEFFIKAILYANKMVCLNEVITNYRVREMSSRSTTHENIEVIRKTFYLCEGIFNDYYIKNPSKELLESFLNNRVIQLYFHFNRVRGFDKRKYYYMLKEIVKYIKSKYGIDFLNVNSVRNKYNIVLNYSYHQYLIIQLFYLFRIHLPYYFTI